MPYFETSARTGECAAMPFVAQAASTLYTKLATLPQHRVSL
jgi:hypothetical protein